MLTKQSKSKWPRRYLQREGAGAAPQMRGAGFGGVKEKDRMSACRNAEGTYRAQLHRNKGLGVKDTSSQITRFKLTQNPRLRLLHPLLPIKTQGSHTQ